MEGPLLLPTLRNPEYYLCPAQAELETLERLHPGYCTRVENFVVGRRGYGHVRFLHSTDVTGLDVDSVVRFGYHEISVYGDGEEGEGTAEEEEEEEEEEGGGGSCGVEKPPVGCGLNKPAEVTLLKMGGEGCGGGEEGFEKKLRRACAKQGAEFVLYDGEAWTFRVKHFSRFSFLDEDSDDEGTNANANANANVNMNVNANANANMNVRFARYDGEFMEEEEGGEESEFDGELEEAEEEQEDNGDEENEEVLHAASSSQVAALSHSLPAHLRLDPVKMQQMRSLFFSSGENDNENMETEDDISLPLSLTPPNHRKLRLASVSSLSKTQQSNLNTNKGTPKKQPKISPPQPSWNRTPSTSSAFTRPPLPLGFDLGRNSSSPSKQPRLLLTYHDGNPETPILKRSRVGFKKELDTNSVSSCVTGRTGDIVDAGLFLGNSFRVGWGPHGMLVHSGSLSSVICIEKVALDNNVRDEKGNVKDELVELQFNSPLSLHMLLLSKPVVDNSDPDSNSNSQNELKFRQTRCSPLELSSVCSDYEDLIAKQHSCEGLSAAKRLLLRHQVMVWHLLGVLFSEKVAQEEEEEDDENEEVENLGGEKAYLSEVDPKLESFTRRAEFSSWLQDSVNHLVQEDVMNLEGRGGEYLKEIFCLLTGRQLDEAVQIAASQGDVRLACLLSQVGGPMVNRQDLSMQIDVWRQEGLDFALVEKERMAVYNLIAGDISGALVDGNIQVDWKRFLGLLMWYHLPPDIGMSEIIDIYSRLVANGEAPEPVPMYYEEATLEEVKINGHHDTAYHLMCLHAAKNRNSYDIGRMFCSFSSTYDALDHQMPWLQSSLLQATGVLNPIQLHILDMSFISQLLSVGLCHWAIYVALHMPPNSKFPGLCEKVVKEILNQYCESWNRDESQRSFIEEELGVPTEWMHEALGTYWQYMGESSKALDHFLKSMQWRKAHLLLMTSVASSLFINSHHGELLEILTKLEKRKMELDNWDIGGGIYMEYYTLKDFLLSNGMVEEQVSFEAKANICRKFLAKLKQSLLYWESRSSLETRVVFARMADEMGGQLLAESNAQILAPAAELSLYDALLEAPVPGNIRLCRLQSAVSAFSSLLSQSAAQ